ncbi:MAG: YqgE/AlgH family protein [Gammaproteobacteria bacterium]|nr:YqgE/AlgH family protein [Gammaproteobacteria bacterium]
MSENLTKHLLVAMPALHDPNFSRSVTLICEHNQHGAMGIVVNQPIVLCVEELISYLDVDMDEQLFSTQREPVYAGGPVHTNRGFVLHDSDRHWKSTYTIDEDLKLTTSEDILLDIGRGTGPDNTIVALGYAGWGPGQLEQELADNAWLTVPYQAKIIFNTPAEKRWQSAASRLGIDVHLISNEAGHA